MNHCAKHILGVGWLACLLLVLSVTSCTDLIFDSREGCERGVYVNFKYDYNLYRADMFADHVGEVIGHRTKRFFQWSGKMGERL